MLLFLDAPFDTCFTGMKEIGNNFDIYHQYDSINSKLMCRHDFVKFRYSANTWFPFFLILFVGPYVQQAFLVAV